MNDLQQRYEAAMANLARFGQEHVLAFWAELSEPQRRQLLDDVDAANLERSCPLIPGLVLHKPSIHIPGTLEPAKVYPSRPTSDLQALYARALRTGRDLVRGGKVAAFTVAGGQGTRLGYDGPKGAFPISPIRHATLFQLFAEMLQGILRRYSRRLRWYIMTSPSNHEETVAFFEANSYFGLRPGDISFFQQGQMPAFTHEGKIALAEKHRIALSPDGHGGSLAALAASGALRQMAADGVELISYFQVDNPLVHAIDPLFLGLHVETASEMSSKAVTKISDTERVGNFCVADGKLSVIEYSDMPDELARARNSDGSRRFDAGSIAIHILSREFVERLTRPGSGVQLPWHRADKKVPQVDATGNLVQPVEPNAVKLEMFVFDAIPLARNPLVLYTERGEEFSPVKNAEGADSPATTQRDMIRRSARWLKQAGVKVPVNAASDPPQPIEISPAFALDAGDLSERIHDNPPQVPADKPLLLTD